MPVLPTQDSLGPLPSGESGRPIAQIDTSAIGRGLAAFGNTLQDVGSTIAERQDESAVTSALSGFNVAAINLDKKFETGQAGQDYANWGTSASNELSATRDKIAATIQNPNRRQAFVDRTNVQIAAQAARIAETADGYARGGRNEALKTSLDNQATVVASAHVRGDAATIDRATAEAVASIDHAAQVGDITPAQNEAFKRGFMENSAAGRVATDLLNDPGGTLKRLQSVGSDSSLPSYYGYLNPSDFDKLLNGARTAAQGKIADTANTAIATTLSYGPGSPDTPSLPTQSDFIAAFGAQDGVQKFDQMTRDIAVAGKRYEFKDQTPAQMKASVDALKPQEGVTPPNEVSDQAKAYDAAQTAAVAELKARSDDPFGYVTRNNSDLAQRWETVAQTQDPAELQSVIRQTLDAQTRIGIPADKLAPLPKAITDSAIKAFANLNLPQEARIKPAADLVLATKDPTQRNVIFDQLVKEGLPEFTYSAFEAMARGDKGAANRLFQAALIDPEKMPGLVQDSAGTVTPKRLTDAIEAQLFDSGKVGAIAYGLQDGQVENMVRASHDTTLLRRTVEMRVRAGESLKNAVTDAGKDIFGDVQVVDRSDAQVLLPPKADAGAIIASLKGQFRLTMRGIMAAQLRSDAPNDHGQQAVAAAVLENHIDRALEDGIIRNSGNGFVLVNKYTGMAFPSMDGKPLVLEHPESSFPEATPAPVFGTAPPEAMPFKGNPLGTPAR